MNRFSRREYLRLMASGMIGDAVYSTHSIQANQSVEAKSVAAVVSVYYYNSHADVILGKILNGWLQDGGLGPALTLASLYVDQFPDGDLARSQSAQHGFPIFDSIEKAVTVGGNSIPVDGVLCICEHGDYPYNDLGQHLYPRRRFFDEIANAFEKYDRVVPVFNDKHLGPTWSDAKAMYDRAQTLKIPFMAGSSLPVGYRTSPINVPMGSEIEAAVGIGYSGLDVYGIHALEFYQCHVERRQHAEQGVKSVQCVQGDAIWKAVDDGVVQKDVLEAAFAAVPKSGMPNMRQDDQATLFLFEYIDGLKGSLFMFSCVSGTSVALKIKGQPQPLATAFDERSVPRHPHFAYLLKAIECMIHTGRPTYPVERTFLTSGILDRSLCSLQGGSTKRATPELSISYTPIDYPYAQLADLQSRPL